MRSGRHQGHSSDGGHSALHGAFRCRWDHREGLGKYASIACERRRAAKPSGTASPFKHLRPNPTDPSKARHKDQNGKLIDKPKPPGHDEQMERSLEFGLRRSEQLFDEALRRLELGEEREAFELTQRASRLGNVEATAQLGWLYFSGVGVEASRDRALRFWRQAARSGVSHAAVNLGDQYLKEGKRALATRWLNVAAELGDGEAWLQIAKMKLSAGEDEKAIVEILERVVRDPMAFPVSQEEASDLLRALSRGR